MEKEKYIASLYTKINWLKKDINKEYQEAMLIQQEGNSFYEFNRRISDLTELIIDLINTKKGIAEIEATLDNMYEQSEEEMYISRLLAQKEGIIAGIKLLDQIVETISKQVLLVRAQNILEFNRFKRQNDLDDINKKLRKLSAPADLSDGEIDIYTESFASGNGIRGEIYLHGEKTSIGFIEYRGNETSEWFGDIGYGINTPHQGHNYAYKALVLMSKLIQDKGIENIYITTYDDNIPSQKTIEKFGGVRTTCSHPRVLRYICNIKDLNFEEQIPTLKQ